MIQDELTGIIYPSTTIKTNLKPTTMKKPINRLTKLKRGANRLKNNLSNSFKDAYYNNSIVYEEIETGELQPEVLTPEALRYFLKYENIKKEKDLWQRKYKELQSALESKQNLDKLIKSIL